jgi:hypothetical protein
LLGAAGALVLVLAVGALAVTRGGGGDAASLLARAGCRLQSFPAVPNAPDHSDVPTLATRPKTWNSTPPTSGPHYAVPAVWDFYDAPVPLVQTVHNLEHGGIVIHYGPRVPTADVEELRAFWESDPDGLVVAPLASNGSRITLSAWTVPDNLVGTADRGRGWLATCTRFDRDAFAAFVREHRFKGPERIDPSSERPGT